MREFEKQIDEILKLKITKKDKEEFDLMIMNMLLKPVLKLVNLFHSGKLKWESLDH